VGTSQRYSNRLCARRQLVKIIRHLQESSKMLLDIGSKYKEASPIVSEACLEMDKLLTMCEAIANDIRDQI